MINFSQELNSEQLKVVEQGNGPCLVLAGAGSGKTRTITYRVAYLLEQGVKPENILLVTFTNKASREMIERVTRLTDHPVSTVVETPLLRKKGAGLPWSGTFHHIGYRLLKKYATVLGYKNNFSVLDSQDSLDLIKLCLKEEGIDRKEKRFPSPAVLQSIISYARNAETTIADVLDLKYEHFLDQSEIITRLAESYQKKKVSANVMDFDDLLVNWYLLLLKEQGIKNKLSEQFQYILVDEYQDTNKIQASIIDLLASKHKNLLVVGDDAQSIYSFRAADIQNILSFQKKYPDAKIFKLETNYRSTPEILDLANNIIANNLNQYEKNLSSLQEKFTKPELQAFADQTEEAEFIANRIEELLSEGMSTKDIAVLFRAAYHSQALEMELVKRGIDYDYRGGVRFFERAHVKDVLAYLRIVNNVEDDIAWRRVLNMQIGIGPATVEKIIQMMRESLPLQGGGQEGVSDNGETPPAPSPYRGGELQNIGAQLPAKAQIGWNDFLQVYKKLNLIEDKNPGDLIAEILDSKYTEYLENEYPDYRERLQDIEQLARYADRRGATPTDTEDADSEAGGLNQFLAEATLQESFTRGQTQTDTRNNVNKIVLSTIHQAKGLEWEAVFVMGLSSGQFPSDRSLREPNGLEEERRLFYVATTRAKKHLHLTYSLTAGSAGSRQGGWGDLLSGPSLFIEEIDVDLINKNDLGGSTVFGDDEIEYVSEDEDVRNTKDAKVRKNVSSFLKSLDDL